jgi:hypothetical protein
MNADPTLLHDPARHFGFSQCHGCMGKPCIRLRNGHIRQGEFLFFTRNTVGVQLCPFAAHAPRSVALFLRTLDLHRLNRHYSRIVSSMSEVERYRANPEAFINGWDDHAGVVEFLLNLLERRIAVALGVPYNYANDAKIKNWFHRFDPTGPLPGEVATPKEEAADEGEALTDATNSATLINPRWEHQDTTRRQASPDVAGLGNTVILYVDTTGIGEGAPVTFDLFDASFSPPRRVDSVKGKNQGGTAQVEWVVQDFLHRQEDLKLEFEGYASGKTSNRATIGVSVARYVFSA